MLETVFQNLFNPVGLFMCILGVVAGIIIGVLPGLSAAMGIALLLPITYPMSSINAFIVLCGLYVGAIYGGSITAILLRTPGTPASGATVLDGYEFTKRGEAGRAIGISTISSTFGGLVSATVLVLFSPVLAEFSLSFTPVEKAALALFGLSIITSISGKSLLKGVMAGLFGMLLSLVGVDAVNGQMRFTLGLPQLYSGFSLVPAMVGLLAMSQAYIGVENIFERQTVQKKVQFGFPEWSDVRRIIPTMIESSLIGTGIGIIPGTGGDIASYVAYNEARRVSKRKEKFGTGIPEGVAASETANNAVTGGALIPMLTLGIPGDAATAVMLGALMLHGMQAGAVFFRSHTDVVYTIFGAMFLSNIVMMLLGLLCVRFFIKVIAIKRYMLTPIVMVLCVIGSYCINNNFFDVWVMFAFGLLGYIMEKIRMPASPMVLAIILGSMFETQLRLGLGMFYGRLSVFFERPVSAVFIAISLFSLLSPVLRAFINAFRKNKIPDRP